MPKLPRDAVTAEFVRSVLEYTPETGVFRWRDNPAYSKRWNTRYSGQIAGYLLDGYRTITIGKGNNFRGNRLAWLYMTGEWPSHKTDHRNGIRHDDRWDNIREADDSENASNKIMQRNNTSGFVGVGFDPQRLLWRARINYRRVMYDLGYFPSAETAAEARQKFVPNIQGDFVPTNVTRPRYKHSRDKA